jgi:drug/metabolite transporter (DMT)-like permease
MQNKLKGLILMFLSTIGFSIVQAIVKYLDASVSSWAKGFYRSAFGLLFLIIWMIIAGKGIKFHNIKVLITRGLFGGLSLAFSFWTIELLSLSHATLYLYIYPMFAPLFAMFFYKEKFRILSMIPLAAAMIGVYFVASPDRGFMFSYKDIIGISGGIFAGIAISSLKELRKTDTSENIYFFFCSAGLIICLLGVLFRNDQYIAAPLNNIFSPAVVWILLIFMGLISTVSQLLMTEAYKSLSTATGSIISLLTMPIVTVVAILAFKENFKLTTLFGGVLIFLSAIGVTLISKYESANVE